MLDFIKKLFAEKEAKKEEVPINRLLLFFEEKKKEHISKLNQEINILNEKIINESQKAEHNITLLEKSHLKNPKITIREKQFMEGNRDAYIKRTRLFLKQIEVPKDAYSVQEFLAKFNEDIDNYSKTTAKPYHILQEFFANESGKLAYNINNIDRVVREIGKKIEDANLGMIDDIKESIKDLNNKIRMKKEKKNELKKKKKELEDVNNLIKEYEKKIKSLEGSKEYNELANLREEKQKIVYELNEHKEKINHSFSILERAMRKYSRIALDDEKLVIAYLEKPIIALRGDSELKIVKILDNMESSILNNTIDLKEAKRKKTVDEIKRLDGGFFERFLSRYTELINKITDFDEKIVSFKVEQSKKEIEKELHNKNKQLKKIEDDIEELKKEVEKIDIEKIKKKNQDDLKKAMNVDIIIS